jgi:hypothetical protein
LLSTSQREAIFDVSIGPVFEPTTSFQELFPSVKRLFVRDSMFLPRHKMPSWMFSSSGDPNSLDDVDMDRVLKHLIIDKGKSAGLEIVLFDVFDDAAKFEDAEVFKV